MKMFYLCGKDIFLACCDSSVINKCKSSNGHVSHLFLFLSSVSSPHSRLFALPLPQGPFPPPPFPQSLSFLLVFLLVFHSPVFSSCLPLPLPSSLSPFLSSSL